MTQDDTHTISVDQIAPDPALGCGEVPQRSSAASRAPMVAGARVQGIIPTTMEDCFRLATAVVKSGLAPKDLTTQEQVLIAIMTGLEVGMPPMQSLQRIAVINGRATIWGDAALGLVERSGLLDGIQERIDGTGDDRVAVCSVRRKGERVYKKSTFSVADAKRAGLWNKSGPWQQYPDRMLQMRARGFRLRDSFSDALCGLYIREELEGVETEMRDITPPPAPAGEVLPPSKFSQRVATADEMRRAGATADEVQQQIAAVVDDDVPSFGDD